jgi:hypothetical protein
LRRVFVFPCLGLLSLVAGCGALGSGPGDAAVVNGHHIPLAAYTAQVAYKDRVQMSGNGGVDVCKGKTFQAICKSMKQSVLNDLIKEELVRQYAVKHHLSVSDAEFQRTWQQVMKDRFDNSQAVLKIWVKQYALTIPELQQMERENLLQQKVMYAVTKNMPVYAPAVRLARLMASSTSDLQHIQKILKTGRSFLDTARLLNGDKRTVCAANTCGELGWLPLTFLPAKERASLQRVKIGSIIGPFADQNGLTILKVEGRNPHYQLTPQQQLSMRQQIFATWVQRLQSRAAVQRDVTV